MKTGLLQPRWYHLLSGQQQIGRFTHHQLQQGGWHEKEVRAVQRGGKGLAELPVADRMGGGSVEGAAALLVFQQEQHGAYQILHMDPAHHLAA